FALLLSATLIDFEHKIIPNKITYPGTVLGVGLSLFRSDFIWLDSLTGIPVGAGLLLVVRFLGSLLFRKEAMGLGDVKLMAVIGAFAGWQAAILSIFLGSIVGTLYSIPLLIKEARTGRRTTHVISFGPFLAIGGLIAALAQDRIWTFLWPV
ncbi:MAG: prepilin peptidase, partial [candidate division Zixibacteria bacterium]|nr:prepilin peptidase [candidate division Zixibacteria bacterium]